MPDSPALISGAPEATVQRGKEQIGVESGVPRALYNVNYAVAAGEPEAMARQYLRENFSRLRLASPELSDLFVRATRRGLAGTVVRFEQRVQGVPVLAPDIAVTIDPRNRVSFVMNGYQPGLALATTTPQVSAAQARAAAIARVGVRGPLASESSRLVVVPEQKAARLAWQFRLGPAVSPIGDWEVLVDAASGEIFRVTDRAFHVNGTGFVFDPDPLSTAHVSYGAAGYVDGGDATTPQLDAARASRTLLDITDIGGGTYKLQGPYAQVIDFESPFNGLFTQASTTFNFDRLANNFEAVNCYFHIDHIMRYINLTLGVPVTPYQYAGGVRYDPSGFNGADNSYYSSGTGQLSFGEGGVDDAEDADVVIHELGHGLHDWVTAGGLSQVDGLSEGTGDFVAASYCRSLGQWASNETPFNWVFDWDGHNPFWPGRITNYGAAYPGGLVGQVHSDGQIWSTCLMRIWNQIGRAQTERAVYEGLAMTNSSSSQNDAAQAVLQAAGALGYPGNEIAVLVSEFQTTGYTVSSGVDFVTNAITDACASDPGNVNGILEPGEETELRVSIEAASLAQTGVSGTLTSSTPGVTILDGTATWPNLSPGVPTLSNAPHFRVKLDQSVACLSQVDFDLSVTSNEGGPYPMSFSREVGASLTPAPLPASIPDNQPAGVTSTLNAPTSFILTDVNVRVEITHTYVGDLFIKIRSPLGTEVTLLDRPGVPATTFGCGNDNMNVTFDDAAAQVLEAYCPGSNPWYSGAAKPVGLLSAFNGQDVQGNWVLTVVDAAGQDVGSVADWELITTPPLAGTCDPCLPSTGVPGVVAGTQRLELSPNHPNPFSSRTGFRFQLERPGRATLQVYDVRGNLVTTILDGDVAAGPQVAFWDGKDRHGRSMPSGIYLYKLASGPSSEMRRMMLVR